MAKKFTGFGKMLYGGDYNPEQWLEYPEILKQDIEYMKKANINVVTLGIFSWAALEPEEGIYTFEWMEERINTLYENGISVILSTPSGSRPKWMADKYEEVLRVDEMRRRNLYGFRHNHCYTSPVYREKVRKMNMELAKHFGNHPGVLAWHLSNELGGECHCPLCQAEFQKWLKQRYGTIENLNKAWYTTFWSHTYQNFEQIESPSPRGETFLHGLNLDWKRFVTDRTVDFVKAETQAIRDGGSDKPTTINMMYHYNGLNYHKFVDVVDFISWDNYPVWYKKEHDQIAMDCGMQHDIMRSMKREPFYLMESCPTSTNWQGVSKLKEPGLLNAASMQAIAHGSDSVLYFQIRQSRGASEKFHGAVIDHTGRDDTRVFREVAGTGADLAFLHELQGSDVEAKVAVIFDWENRWAMEDAQGPRNNGLYYKETVEKSYYAFRKAGFDVDVIDMEQSLEKYRIVAVPMLYLFRAGIVKKMRTFVENGGILIMTYWSGVVNENDLCYLGEAPHGLTDVLGIRRQEIDGLYDGMENYGMPVTDALMDMREKYTCKYLCELVEMQDAEVLMVYGADFYAGKPVLTRNCFGKGKAYYICADMEQAFYDDLYKKVAAENGVTPILKGIELPEGVEITSRRTEKEEYVFLQNWKKETVCLEISGKWDILLGRNKNQVQPLETIVLKRKR